MIPTLASFTLQVTKSKGYNKIFFVGTTFPKRLQNVCVPYCGFFLFIQEHFLLCSFIVMSLMNSFFLFCKDYREKVKEDYPNQPNAFISSVLGSMWRNLPEEEKLPYKEKAFEYKEVRYV